MAIKETERMIIELRPHQRAFIKQEATKNDCSMTKVIRELVEKEIQRRALKAKKSLVKTS